MIFLLKMRIFQPAMFTRGYMFFRDRPFNGAGLNSHQLLGGATHLKLEKVVEESCRPPKTNGWFTWKYPLGKGETCTNHQSLGFQPLVFRGVDIMRRLVKKGSCQFQRSFTRRWWHWKIFVCSELGVPWIRVSAGHSVVKLAGNLSFNAARNL